jgi:hypothetical protein
VANRKNLNSHVISSLKPGAKVNHFF